MHVVETDRHLGVPFASGDGGQEQTRQDGDDGYNDEKFNQREGPGSDFGWRLHIAVLMVARHIF